MINPSNTNQFNAMLINAMQCYAMQVMDGLTRRELEFVPLRVKRSISRALEDKDESIRAYVVGGRNVLKSWVSHHHSFDSILPFVVTSC